MHSPHSQFMRLRVPSGFLVGLATKPYTEIERERERARLSPQYISKDGGLTKG